MWPNVALITRPQKNRKEERRSRRGRRLRLLREAREGSYLGEVLLPAREGLVDHRDLGGRWPVPADAQSHSIEKEKISSRMLLGKTKRGPNFEPSS